MSYKKELSRKKLHNFLPQEDLKDNLVAGIGYSTDSQQIVAQPCYNATPSSISGQNSIIKIDTSTSFADLQKALRIDVKAKGKFGMFSTRAKASYVRSVQDQDYSISLNYYQYTQGDVSINLAGYGEAALNDFGRMAYSDSNNPYFGIICGDNYVNSYEVGALLTFGINILFKNHDVKTAFQVKFGVSFADIVSASAKIQQAVKQGGYQGSIAIQAFQEGGDPTQLAKILTKDPSGNYYASMCSLASMDNCTKAASGLLNYAVNNFPTQFSFRNNTGLTSIGVGFAQYTPIMYIGLTPPPSFVTPQVIAEREELATRLQVNQYYQQKFLELTTGYPVAWDVTSAVYKASQGLYQQATNNVNIIMDPDPYHGAIGCFKFPNECDGLFARINATLVPITAADLNIFEGIKYYYDLPYFLKGGFGMFMYANGDENNHWAGYKYDPNILPTFRITSMDHCIITPTIYDTKFTGTGTDGKAYVWTITGTGTGNDYVCNSWVNRDYNYTSYASRYNSTFYPEEYKSTDDVVIYSEALHKSGEIIHVDESIN